MGVVGQFVQIGTELLFAGKQKWEQVQAIFGQLVQDLTSHSDVNFRVKYRDRKSSEATDVEEIEANFFAASILMPRDFLDAARAFEALGDDEDVARLASLFEVSNHAMSLRLANEYSHQRPF